MESVLSQRNRMNSHVFSIKAKVTCIVWLVDLKEKTIETNPIGTRANRSPKALIVFFTSLFLWKKNFTSIYSGSCGKAKVKMNGYVVTISSKITHVFWTLLRWFIFKILRNMLILWKMFPHKWKCSSYVCLSTEKMSMGGRSGRGWQVRSWMLLQLRRVVESVF